MIQLVIVLKLNADALKFKNIAINKNSTIEPLFKNKKKGTIHTLIQIEDSEDVLVFECNNVGLKKLSKF